MEDYCLIPLHGKHGKGKFAEVSPEDYRAAEGRRWYVLITPQGASYVYAGRMKERIALHRFLTDAPRGMDVDHVNRDTLDNRRSNLRVCTRAENNYNRGPARRATSKYKGVHFDRSRGHNKWRAEIRFEGKRMKLGSFDSEVAAARAYDDAAKRLHGAFARTNF